jgi:hypothetical protein
MKQVILVWLVGAAACSGPASGVDGGGGGFEVSGVVTGSTSPGKVAVLWAVSSGSPDYTYKFGDGNALVAGFTLSLTADPPAAAINSYGIGVGVVGLFATGTTIPDGVFNAATYPPLGFSGDYAIIWKDPTAAGLGQWDTAFAPRYSCGKCKLAQPGMTFDSFELTPCANVTIDLAPGAHVCNWT